eukprot:CAMPEP_0178903728 /NCGR_PEP_ID=MMETSP0786-20121207/5312_1 /TAXON_ID=186022 /ORGANISM="Thalassionema frauenfeldii, Strain CCMP 1798" /LENGTH=230 /DNA_ID=CAMNT_0020575119 /DNA_START=48 /DNA_END=737 /DNA_ORIENTATION=-
MLASRCFIVLIPLLAIFSETTTTEAFSPGLKLKRLSKKLMKNNLLKNSSAAVGSSSSNNTPHNERKQQQYKTALKLVGGASCLAAIAVPSAGKSLLTAADHCFRNYPILSNMGTYTVKSSLADIVAQTRDSMTQKFSFRRNLTYIVNGAVFTAVVCEIIYNQVYPAIFGIVDTTTTLLLKVALDCLVCAPIYWIPSVYFVKALFYGNSFRQAGKEYIQDVKYRGLLTTYW